MPIKAALQALVLFEVWMDPRYGASLTRVLGTVLEGASIRADAVAVKLAVSSTHLVC